MVDTSFYAGEVINSGQAVFIEPCISQEYSVTDSENSTTPTSLSGSVSDARGFKMLQNITATVTHITKTSSCTATRAIIANNA